MDVAEAYRNAGRLREATPAFEDALARLKALGRERTETAGTLLNNWALSVDLQGRHLEAEALYRRAIAISSADGSESNVSPMLMNNLARSLKDLGRLREAAGYADRAHAAAVAARNETVVSQSLMVRASTYRELGRLDEAATLLDELEVRWRKAGKSAAYSGFATLASERAMLAQRRGDFETARAKSAEALRILEPSAGELGDFIAWILGRRANLHLEMRRFADAEVDARRAVDLWTKAIEPGARSGWIGRCGVTLGKSLAAQGRGGEARREFAAAVQHLEVSLGADHPEAREARRLAAGAPAG
jgi:tetratricopeptide (TPR) repeat protein